MTTPKRNEAVARFSPHKGLCVREAAGRYVLYSDYEALQGEVSRLRAQLDASLKFIDGVRDDLHNRRTADWYPEGAHNAAEQMSEDMRLIGNACADFDPYTLNLEPPTDGR